MIPRHWTITIALTDSIEVFESLDKIKRLLPEQGAKRLGFAQKEYIEAGADDLHLAWIKKHNLLEMWDVRFGLGGGK